MTETEQPNYAHIEKELLAIVFACERFNDYIYGRDIVHLETNHKTLESIFKREIHLAPKRMRLRLQKYPLDIRYKKGSEMYVADMLSQAYTTGDKWDPRSVVNNDVSKVDSEDMMYSDRIMLPEEKLVDLQHATKEDIVLQELEKAIKTGWQGSSRDKEVLKPYLRFKDDLLVEDGLIFKRDRLVIPCIMRAGMVQLVHQGHIGVKGCLRRACELIYWPGMNADVKDHISKYDVCNAHLPEQCHEELQTHEFPHLPWAKVAADLFELDRKNYVILVCTRKCSKAVWQNRRTSLVEHWSWSVVRMILLRRTLRQGLRFLIQRSLCAAVPPQFLQSAIDLFFYWCFCRPG